MKVFTLTFLVKLCISLSISLLIISHLFVHQTAQFKTSFRTSFLVQWIRTPFLFIQWIKTPHLTIINSYLLIQLWFHCRPLLTINISCCSLHQKTQIQIYIISLIKIELNSYTISEMKMHTDLTTHSSLECTMIKLQISMISLTTTKMTTIATVSFSKKMIEQTTSLMRIRLSLKSIKKLWKSMRMLTSIML